MRLSNAENTPENQGNDSARPYASSVRLTRREVIEPSADASPADDSVVNDRLKYAGDRKTNPV